ncbi:MAG: hypothetical protein A2V66_05080 [Ignavibacteria bacterium RBG_13_36_8]|nr:MAG: hypothetical protein A2V66_05080 [Ignavibacteria bacterium RBG_13_36_8]
MNYLIGIDGGASKTNCVITDLNLNIVHKCTGGPSNFLVGGIDESVNIILNLIDTCAEKLMIDYNDVGAIVLGIAGAGREESAEYFKERILRQAGKLRNSLKSLCVVSDARIALEGAFSGNAGCVFIAGTGSILLCKDSSGEIHRVGGYGRVIGDEGSGYSIGRKGLNAMAKSYDGRCLKTMLEKIFEEKFDVKNTDSLIEAVYSKNMDIASIVPLVINCAEKNDEVCLNILEEECEEIILHIRAALAKTKEPALKLCLVGGLVENENFYSVLLREKISKALPEVEIQAPQYPPEIGAVLIAKKKLCQ